MPVNPHGRPGEKGARTLGLFLGTTEDSYGQALLSGALDAATRASWRLMCVSGGSIRSMHGMEAQRNVLYQVVDARHLDALVLAGSLSHNVSEEELEAFRASYGSLPVVAMSVALPATPCVRADNRTGMAAMMDHLLDEHGYRRIAFIGGPRGQQEAELRREVFLAALRKRGLGIEPRWMVDGDYTRASGEKAALDLLDAGLEPRFQVIVSVNDSMALGACSALASRGLEAGRDYFITGFDDMDEAYFHDPPLTTVRQSPTAQAREASRLAMAMAEGREPPPSAWRGPGLDRQVPTELVVRTSCGCPASHQEVRGGASVEDEWDDRLRRSWEDLNASAAEGEPFDEDAFFARLAILMEKGPPSAGADFWQGKLDALRQGLAPQGRDIPRRVEDLLHRARRFCFAHESRKAAERTYSRETLEDRMHGLRDALVTTFDIPAVLDSLERDLPALGFGGAWLSLFDRPDEPKAGANLLFAMMEGRRQSIPASGLPFPTNDIVPGGLTTLGQAGPLLLLEALYSREEHLGFLLVSSSEEASFLSGTLRTVVSASIHGTLLLEERSRTETKLLESEKMASLGSLVAGVAHEINTPLGVAVTAASFLEGRAAEMARLLEAGELKRSRLDEWIAQAAESGAIIRANLARAADLVASFKQVAVDQSADIRRRFDLKGYLEETLLSLRPQWKRRRVRVSVEGDEGVAMDSYPGALAQIATNLLTNALIHAFGAEDEGTFRIVVRGEGDFARVEFIDDGAGIDADLVERVFEPFYTTKRGQGGSGLGLHIVRSLARSPLGGSVSCASRPGEGTIFTLAIPRIAPTGADGT